jgi:[ribosomal protein S18]-alanine N-acetyltransferase
MMFRAATVDDVATLSALMQRAFEARYGEGWTGTQLFGTMALPGTHADVAVDDGAPAGFTLMRTAADEVELLLIAVDPEHRGRGIARALMQRAIVGARGRGARRMVLEVRAGNNAAQQLYSGFDFVCVGTRKAYYQGAELERFDAITMARPL